MKAPENEEEQEAKFQDDTSYYNALNISISPWSQGGSDAGLCGLFILPKRFDRQCEHAFADWYRTFTGIEKEAAQHG